MGVAKEAIINTTPLFSNMLALCVINTLASEIFLKNFESVV